jgi:uncharacterized membrane protein
MIRLDMSVADAIKSIISLGAVTPEYRFQQSSSALNSILKPVGPSATATAEVRTS